MLKTIKDGKLWLVTQPDHGQVAGYLAAHWGNHAGFAKPGYFTSSYDEELRQQTVLGIAQHDSGWWEWEAMPDLSPADGLPLDLAEVLFGNGTHVTAGAVFVLPKCKQVAAVLNREPKRTRPSQERQFVNVAVAKGAVAVGVAQRFDQPDILVIADGFGRQARLSGNVTDIHAVAPFARLGAIQRSRNALVRTKTLESAMAPAPSAGDRSQPKIGKKTPAATGISSAL